MTEFDDVIRLLEDSRPQATDRELDEMITWLNLTPGVRISRNERVIKLAVVIAGFAACFLLALFF